jgi:hypothetical protein
MPPPVRCSYGPLLPFAAFDACLMTRPRQVEPGFSPGFNCGPDVAINNKHPMATPRLTHLSVALNWPLSFQENPQERNESAADNPS